jgi:hypothetical protein
MKYITGDWIVVGLKSVWYISPMTTVFKDCIQKEDSSRHQDTSSFASTMSRRYILLALSAFSAISVADIFTLSVGDIGQYSASLVSFHVFKDSRGH